MENWQPTTVLDGRGYALRKPTNKNRKWERKADDPENKNSAEREKVSAVVSAGVAIGLVILADINDDFRCEIMGFKWYVWNVDGDKEPTCIRRR